MALFGAAPRVSPQPPLTCCCRSRGRCRSFLAFHKTLPPSALLSALTPTGELSALPLLVVEERWRPVAGDAASARACGASLRTLPRVSVGFPRVLAGTLSADACFACDGRSPSARSVPLSKNPTLPFFRRRPPESLNQPLRGGSHGEAHEQQRGERPRELHPKELRAGQ